MRVLPIVVKSGPHGDHAWDRGNTMIVSFDPSDTNGEFHLVLEDRDHEQTPERAAEMRARGRQVGDEHRRWRTTLPETEPTAAAALARVVITDPRARGTTCPDEVTAWGIGADDDGELWVPGRGASTASRASAASVRGGEDRRFLRSGGHSRVSPAWARSV
ncbi:hypothetical protein ACF1B0_28865 [Streptomyces anandii]|uniref:hypothetical protein n=1 Tax=Streptomyces anandii TaxID=285454 RepID=UPI003702BF60